MCITLHIPNFLLHFLLSKVATHFIKKKDREKDRDWEEWHETYCWCPNDSRSLPTIVSSKQKEATERRKHQKKLLWRLNFPLETGMYMNEGRIKETDRESRYVKHARLPLSQLPQETKNIEHILVPWPLQSSRFRGQRRQQLVSSSQETETRREREKVRETGTQEITVWSWLSWIVCSPKLTLCTKKDTNYGRDVSL